MYLVSNYNRLISTIELSTIENSKDAHQFITKTRIPCNGMKYYITAARDSREQL